MKHEKSFIASEPDLIINFQIDVMWPLTIQYIVDQTGTPIYGPMYVYILQREIIPILLHHLSSILPQNALRRDFNGKCIEMIEGHYLEVVVEV